VNVRQVFAGFGFWLAAGAVAQAQEGEAKLLQDARSFGKTVGYAVSCGLADSAIKAYTRQKVSIFMPATGDAEMDARMDSAFNEALHMAATQSPPQGCEAIAREISATP
jgi:hypothetical protein